MADKLEKTGILDTLDALANYYSAQYPSVLLDDDFLSGLETNLSGVLADVLEADVSRDLKRFLISRLEAILSAVRRYSLDGTEGLKEAVKIATSDLVLNESNLDESERKSFSYKRVSGWICALLVYFTPLPNAWEVIGAVPDVHDFWIPKIEELVSGEEDIEKAIERTSKIQDALDEVSGIFNKEPQKQISGQSQPKALPAAKEDDPTSIDDGENLQDIGVTDDDIKPAQESLQSSQEHSALEE